MCFPLAYIPLDKHLAFSRNFFITCVKRFYVTHIGTLGGYFHFLHKLNVESNHALLSTNMRAAVRRQISPDNNTYKLLGGITYLENRYLRVRKYCNGTILSVLVFSRHLAKVKTTFDCGF